MKKTIIALVVLLMVLTLAACTQQAPKKADLNAVMADIEKNVTVSDMMSLTAENVKTNYGIDASDALQFVYKINREGTKADEIAMFEAKDADAARRIREKLEARRTVKANEANNYSPEQYQIIMESSVQTYGNYVTMFVGPDAGKMTGIFESYVK
ncbi:MAG: DUF4358 domain-containing protein [Bacillota bacterium]